MGNAIVKLILICAALVAWTSAAKAQGDMTDCKTSIMGALAGAAPMPPPMPMPGLKANEPMPTGMAKDSLMKGDVGAQAAMQDKCMDDVLSKDQSDMDKKN